MPFLDNLYLRSIRNKSNYFILIKNFSYKHEKYGIITAKMGFQTDFTTVPNIISGIISPIGIHKEASVIHDWLYVYHEELKIRRDVADQIFFDIMKEYNIPFISYHLIKFFVKIFGGIWFNRDHEKYKVNSLELEKIKNTLKEDFKFIITNK